MKRTKIKCLKCYRDISKSNYHRHVESCGRVKVKKIKKIRGVDYDPNHGYITGDRVAWNKGLTKNTSPIVAQYTQTRKKNYKDGKFSLGSPHTQKSKDKISKSRIKFLTENPDKVPYLLNHSSKGMSWPEQQFSDKLKKENIIGWYNEFRNGLYSYDFAWPDIKLDIEIDGGTHEQENVKIKDLKRDTWSKKQGWTVLRFTWKDIRYNLDNCIITTKKKIKELQ